MASPYTQPARGIRKSSPIVDIAVAATPEVLYTRTAGGQNPRTVIVRKIIAYSDVGNAVLDIGTALAPLVNNIPSLAVLGGLENIWTEDEIPEVEVGADITVQCSVAHVDVQVEVEEIE